jgi:hypothetical protein
VAVVTIVRRNTRLIANDVSGAALLAMRAVA